MLRYCRRNAQPTSVCLCVSIIMVKLIFSNYFLMRISSLMNQILPFFSLPQLFLSNAAFCSNLIGSLVCLCVYTHIFVHWSWNFSNHFLFWLLKPGERSRERAIAHATKHSWLIESKNNVFRKINDRI